VQAAGFANLLLDEIVTEASDLEIVLDAGIDCNDCFSYGHLRLASLIVNARVNIELVEDEDLIFGGTLVHTEEQVLSHFAVVGHLVRWAFNAIRVAVVAMILARSHFLLVEDDQDLTED